jgi:hypothetical protein
VESLPNKRRIIEKKGGARIEKKKRGETSVEKLHVLRKEKKERMKFTSCRGRLYQKKERKKERRSQFPIVQNSTCGIIHTHTSFAFARLFVL